ncbi:MAG: AI-2E family transporter [Planctomycetota bacterium]
MTSFRDVTHSHAFKMAVYVLMSALFALFIYALRDVLNPFLIGAIIAYVLEPLVRKVMGFGLSRPMSVVAVYMVVLLVSGVIIAFTVVGLERQIRDIAMSIPDDTFEDANGNGKWEAGETLLADHNANGTYDLGYRGILRGKAEALIMRWNAAFPTLSFAWEDAREAFKTKMGLSNLGLSASDGIGYGQKALAIAINSAGGFGWFLLSLVLIPLYAFLLQNLVPPMSQKMPALIPADFRARTLSIFKRIDREISAFFRGKIIVCFLKGLLTWALLAMLGVRFSFFIGFLAGALSVIPYLGAVTGSLFAVSLGFLDGLGLMHAVWVLVVFAIMEVIEFFLNMVVFGKEVGVHPLAFILSLFIGGELFGLFGVIMSVPLLSVATILFKEFVVPLLNDLSDSSKAPSQAL